MPFEPLSQDPKRYDLVYLQNRIIVDVGPTCSGTEPCFNLEHEVSGSDFLNMLSDIGPAAQQQHKWQNSPRRMSKVLKNLNRNQSISLLLIHRLRPLLDTASPFRCSLNLNSPSLLLPNARNVEVAIVHSPGHRRSNEVQILEATRKGGRLNLRKLQLTLAGSLFAFLGISILFCCWHYYMRAVHS